MPIEFRCTHCNKLLRTKDDSAGKQAKCPECGTRLTVPAADAAPADPGPPPRPGAHGDFSEEDFGVGNPYSAPRSSLAHSPPSARIELGDVLSRTWRIFKANLGICILAFVVIAAVFIAVELLFMGLASLLSRVAGNNVASGVGAMFGLFGGALSIYLQTGLQFLMLKIARGEEAAIGDLFGGAKWFANIAVASIVFGILGGLGSLLIVGGVIVSLYLWPFPYVIIERNVGPIESLTLAAEATKGNRLTVFLLLIVIWLCAIPLLCCTLFLGLIVFVPFVFLLMPVTYLAMTGQRTADQIEH